MTKLMEQAIEKLRSLPEDAQDAVAGFVLSELQENQRWEQTSLQHTDKLRQLADEALDDLRAGRATPLDPEAL